MEKPKTIWSFDLGKGSIGEAVRVERASCFLHKAVLLIPAEHAQRGPASKSGTPASRYRMWRTRIAHDHREAWLDELWHAAGFELPAHRIVGQVGGETHKYRKRIRGKEKTKRRLVNAEWKLTQKGDECLEREFAGPDEPLHTSCLLRIVLLQGQPLSETWQIYKALFSALQKRGYSDVPWKDQRKGKEAEPSEEEKAENARAGQRWQEFLDALAAAGLGEEYQRACYYDAWRMKLWTPTQPRTWITQPNERPESTQKVAFPGRIMECELLDLARAAAEREPKLAQAFERWLAEYRARVHARVEAANVYRREKGKKELTMPDFSYAARDFAELLVYGVGGGQIKPSDRRAIASFETKRGRTVGLRPGTPDDWRAAYGQRVARFDNRLRSDCALIPRLNCCRNTGHDDIAKATSDDPRLLPAQVTFLMKLKNLRVQERDAKRTQRGLTANEITDCFNEYHPQRKYQFTKGEWRKWCGSHDLLPVLDSQDKAKPIEKKDEQPAEKKSTKTEYAVERASTEGRSRFSRPALRLLKELILNGDAPSVFHERLVKREEALLKKLGLLDVEDGKTLNRIFGDSNDEQENRVNRKKGLLVSDLAFLLRMRKQNEAPDTWEALHIPTQGLDHIAQEANADEAHRYRAIRQLIGLQNNPIVRHRLDTFWARLKILARLKDRESKQIGEPAKIIIELVRDDPESSWLGKEAQQEIKKAQDDQRDKRDRAKKRQAEMGDPHGDLMKFMLWEAQGGHCLYGAPAKSGDPREIVTAIPFTSISKCRVDHIVPRAKGGPDAFYNLILTTDESNSRKGDRTPSQWFHQDQMEQWDAYRDRVLKQQHYLGSRKVRLLISADAEQLVESYKPLAETAWIARLAQTIASLHFGWANGVDVVTGKRRVFIVSGGLTARIRRRYHLDSLLGNDRSLDGEVSSLLREQVALRAELAGMPEAISERNARYPRLKEIKARLRELRDTLSEKTREAEKQRGDKRHHGLDAMVLNCLEGWMNDPNREDEIRLEELGDAPCYPSERIELVRKIRSEIIAQQAVAAKTETVEERERLQIQITKKHDGLAALRQPPNVIAVRESIRRELSGDEATSIAPVLPRQLYYEKPRLEATFHRGVWLRAESETKVAKATIENFDQAYVEDRVALELLPYLVDGNFSQVHGLRRIAGIVGHKDYDATAILHAVEGRLSEDVSMEEWQDWCRSDAAPRGLKSKKGQPETKDIYVYRLEDKRTKRVRLFDLGVGSRDVDEYDRGHFEFQISRLVSRPERGKDSLQIPLEADALLQNKLGGLQSRLEHFFTQYPPDAGDMPRKQSERAAWQAKRDEAKKAWELFLNETGLNRHKFSYVQTDGPSVTERRYEKAGIRSLLLVKTRRFDPDQALKQTQSIADAWIRFQLRQFLSSDPQPQHWKAFCGTFVQVTREAYAGFLNTLPAPPERFITFYQEQAEAGDRNDFEKGKKMRSLIRYVQQVIGNGDAYVDVSKDGSGIYAKGGNKGYFVWKRTIEGEEKPRFGATAVRGFEAYADAKQRLIAQPGTELLDNRLWRTGMMLMLPKDTPCGKTPVPGGFYRFRSISGGTDVTLEPLAGGDLIAGKSIATLLAGGLRQHIFADESAY